MDRLFYPQSVAVVGVSEDPDNLARVIYENLLEFQFQGEILLIGKKEGILHGRTIHASFDDVPEGIDVAVILTPAATVPGILESCGKRGIRWAIFETGGFGEYSEEGKQLGQRVLEIARKWGIRIVGPNGLGIMNTDNGFVVPFVAARKNPLPPGKISILAQSGGISFMFWRLLTQAYIGVAKIVSMGNKLDLDEIDYLKYLEQDPKTSVIGLYLEGIRRGRELMEAGCASSKPLIVHKANTGGHSEQIAKHHTSALANDDRVVEAALRQANIVRTRDFRSFLNIVRAFSIPPMRGNELVIISRSGGFALIASDTANRYGFRLHPFSKSFRQHVHNSFRAKVIQPTNPLDLGDLFDFDLYVQILEAVLRIKAVKGILFHHGAIGKEEEASRRLVQKVKELAFHYQKPVAFCYFTSEEELAFVNRLVEYPIFLDPTDALEALAISRDHYLGKKKEKGRPVSFRVKQRQVQRLFQAVKDENRDPSLPEAFEVLKAYRIKVAAYQVIHEKKRLLPAMNQVGKPFALKFVSSEISHKTDQGGVILDLHDSAQAERAFEKMKRAGGKRISGILLQKMVRGGMEVILGAKRDPSFGPVILFGLGGIYVELLKETSLRVAPITRIEAEEMVFESKAAAILRGARGQRPFDTKTLIENLLRLSQLMVDFPEIDGIDINPVIVLEKGAIAVDARISLKSPDSPLPE